MLGGIGGKGGVFGSVGGFLPSSIRYDIPGRALFKLLTHTSALG